MRPRWHKVWRDLLSSKGRTFLVVLSIAIGVFAVGMVITTRTTLAREMTRSYAAINPSSAVLSIEPFDDELVRSIRRTKQVGAVEGRRKVAVRVQVGPDEWRNLELSAIPDFRQIEIDKIRPAAGAWPPAEKTLLVERASIDFLKAGLNDSILIEAPNGRQRRLQVVGLVHDQRHVSAAIAGSAYGYITLETLEWLGLPRTYNELHLVVADAPLDQKHIEEVTQQVQAKVERSGRAVLAITIPEPGKHPADNIVQALILILGALGLASLLLGGFLIFNTLAALLAQQTRQIGIMKAIGARRNQIMALYLGTIVAFALPAIAAAVPLSALAARGLANFAAGFLNFSINAFDIPLEVFALEILIGLIVPLLAGLYPILAGIQITVREAISDVGMGKTPLGASWGDRLLLAASSVFVLRYLPRPLLLSLRNTIRRKGRLALTLATLVLASTAFLATYNARAALLARLADAFNYWNFDVIVYFVNPYRTQRIDQETLKVPGVTHVESQGRATARRVRPDGSESESITLIAPLAETTTIRPVMLQGRWLLPGDENAAVIDTELLRTEPDVRLDSEIVLRIEGQQSSWRVVGIMRADQFSIPSVARIHVNFPYFQRRVHQQGSTASIVVQTSRHDGIFQAQVAKALEEDFKQAGLRVGSIHTTTEVRNSAAMIFNVIIVLLFIMVAFLALVGSIGLIGTMMLNVLERTREIGVMRAIGASDRAIQQIVVAEGVCIGIVSWGAGALLALPLSALLSDAVGIALMHVPLNQTFAAEGILIWLALMTSLAALASFLPAWSASRLTVHDILAYE